MLPNEWQIDDVISRALGEDLSLGDATTRALIPPELKGRGSFLVKEGGVLAGIPMAERVFKKVDPEIQMEILIQDGSKIKRGDIIARVSGNYGSILSAERTAVNFLQHLSGIATATSLLVDAVKDLPVKILDTRKTLPGLRVLQKYAVRMGGAQNHRMNLGDGILIKDNHIEVLSRRGMSLKDIIKLAKERSPATLKVEIEVKTPEQAREAAEAGADIVLLDNMSPSAMRQAVKLINGRVPTEASGGISIANVRAVAESGVNFISSGSITHSVKALDISLEFEIA